MEMSKTSEQSSNEYLGDLIELHHASLGRTPKEQDVVWIGRFGMVSDHLLDPRNLPASLALIHPDFYTHRGKSIKSSLQWEVDTDFRGGINRVDQCQAETYLGVTCMANQFPEIRGKCQADHRWPNSLGGPSLKENRIVLCRFHNGMKSNDVTRFDWSAAPVWLPKYLGTI